MSNLYGQIGYQSQNRQLGEKFGITVQFVTQTGPKASEVYLSSTFDCWDSLKNPVVVAFPVTTTATYKNGTVKLWYVMATGANKTITQPGTYTYLFSVKTSDGDITEFRQVAIINPIP